MVSTNRSLMMFFLIAALLFPGLHAPGEMLTAGYRVAFVMGTVELRKDGKSFFLKNGDYVKEGDIIFVDDKSMVELRPEQGDASYKITGPVIYRCAAKRLDRDFSRNSLIYRLYVKLAKGTYHYYPRTVVSAVRGEKDEAAEVRNREQSEALKEAIDLFRSGRLDESQKKFESVALQQGLQKHVRFLIDFYRAEILFTKMEYPGALDLYLSVYNTRNPKFVHREVAHCRAVLCAVYMDMPDRARELIAEYEDIYGKNGAYTPLLDELKKDLLPQLKS